ncbi:MAG TPA: alpha-amylase family protein [Mucilaginibacter sp.]|jgi:hypothetical protein
MNFSDSNNGDSRRSFLKKIAAVTATIASADLVTFAADHHNADHPVQVEEIPWFRRVTRWGQTNITEKDPQQYDITWWRKQWKRTNVQGVIINAGGIVSYYPSKVPLHQPSRFLNGRDLFGELCHAAREDGLAIFARMDSNRASEEFYNAHPDWFAIDITGKPYKAGDLYITCVNGPYYNTHIPAILREIITLYHPDGFTDNSWSGLGRDKPCYCDNCRKSFRAKTGSDIPNGADWGNKTYQRWIRWNYDRRLEIWDLNNQVTKTVGGPNCVWSGMNSGSISGQSLNFRDYKCICDRADILMIDDQGRSDSSGFQHNADIGKFLHGLVGWDKLIPESMAMYQQGSVQFRLSSKPAAEARMWMIAGIAGGIQPWWHHVSAYHEDRRMYHTAAPIMKWHKTNEKFLINRQPIATVGVVWSQENTDFYGRDKAANLVDQPWRGMVEALIRARIPYISVHADHIERDASKLSLLILPNLGAMTDNQVNSVRRFVNNGGGLIATDESSLYDEWGNARSDYALSDLFGAHITGDHSREKSFNTAHTYLRLSPELRRQVDGPEIGNEPIITGSRHPVLKGFEETDILPYGGQLWPLQTAAGVEVLMTFIPEFPIYPPETAWMRQPKTDIPGLILNTKLKGRVAFVPADIDRLFGQHNLPDHGDLLKNLVRWTAKENIPINVEGAGLIDCHLYQQSGCLILHLVNLANSATWRQPIHELIPVGPFKVKVKLPDDVHGKNIDLLVYNQKPSVSINNGWASFEVKTILDHELIVLT